MYPFKIFIFGIAIFSLPCITYAQGVIKGRVVFEGTPPSPETVEVKSDIPTCGNQKQVRKLVLGEGQGIANAIVTLIGVKGELKPEDGILDQAECEFQPHVQVVALGSTLKITSSDSVLHNAHGFYEDGSTAFNLAVPIVGMEVPFKTKQAGLIKLRCDAGHTWMSAYIRVTDTPYYAVTDANGNFTIQGIPPGEYEIEVWQEWLGKHLKPITIGEGEQPFSITLKKPA